MKIVWNAITPSSPESAGAEGGSAFTEKHPLLFGKNLTLAEWPLQPVGDVFLPNKNRRSGPEENHFNSRN